MTGGDRLTVSVAIPTLHRPDDVGRCLRSILAGTEMPLEVLVVDQSDDGATRAVVQSLASPLVRHVPHQPKSQCGARNRALAEARGDYMAFIDDDTELPPDWLATIRLELERFDRPDAIYGDIRTPAGAEAEGLMGEQRVDAPREWRRPVHPSRLGWGCQMIIRRSACQELGGFDERLGPGSSLFCADDLDFNYRLLAAGRRAVSTPAFHVVHHHHKWRDPERLGRVWYGYSLGNAAFAVKYVLRRDPFAVYMLLRQAASDAKHLVLALRRRSRLGARIALHRAAGTIAGLRAGWRVFGRSQR